MDELVGGSRAAAWPLIRHDLRLSYEQIGLVLALPGLFGSALDPVIGLVGSGSRRRALVVAGGVAFALSVALTGAATGFVLLLIALAIGNPASGAFVSLAQATLMNREPQERERNMARWTIAGSVGYVAGPLLIAFAVWSGGGWRMVLFVLALPAIPLALAAPRSPTAATRESIRGFVAAIRTREVARWLTLLELTDLLGDVLHSFVALYIVDVADASPLDGAAAVATWTAAAFVGDIALLWILRRIGGMRWLRVSAWATFVAYPAFLLVPSLAAKLVLLGALGLLNAGWYALPQARLYDTLHGRSGTAVAVGGIGGLAGALVPAGIGLLAGVAGLGTTMWVLLLAPVAILVLVRRDRTLSV